MLKLFRNPLSRSTPEKAKLIFEDFKKDKIFILTLEDTDEYKAHWFNENTGVRYPVCKGNKIYPYGLSDDSLVIIQGDVEHRAVDVIIHAEKHINIRRADVKPNDDIKKQYKKNVKFSFTDRIKRVFW